MAFTPGFNGTLTTGTTPVTLVPAPPERTQRMVRKLFIQNADNNSATVTDKHVTSGGSTFILHEEVLIAGAEKTLEHIVLDASTQTVTVTLAGAVTTTELSCTAHFADLGP